MLMSPDYSSLNVRTSFQMMLIGYSTGIEKLTHIQVSICFKKSHFL